MYYLGNQKFELQVPSTTTITELCASIEKETQIPVHCQRVIYNGRALNGPNEDLNKSIEILGLKSPAKILVLGKKPDEEDDNYKVMKKWEVMCDSASKQLTEFHKEIDDMEKVN